MRKTFLLLALLVVRVSWASDIEDVQTCLANWKDHPFTQEKPKFRVVTSKVRVMGVGAEMADQTPTDKPELVLIKPSVNVMSKSTLRLLNPNGWYCLKGKVAVLGKTDIKLHCKAHMTASDAGATVLGSDNSETGVTVLGKTSVERQGCVQ